MFYIHEYIQPELKNHEKYSIDMVHIINET